MKKLLVIGLAVLMVLGLSGIAMAGDVNVTTVGSVATGYVDIDGKSYNSGGNLGAHHSFDAWGSFNFEVDFLAADGGKGYTGVGVGNLDMNIHQAESQSYAGFQALWRQDFDETSNHCHCAGVFGLYAEGTDEATMNLPDGNQPYYRSLTVSSGYQNYELSAGGTTPIPGTTDPLSPNYDPTSPAYIVQSWVESYASYSDIGTIPPTDWSSIEVNGAGGKATMDFGGQYTGSGSSNQAAYTTGYSTSRVGHGCYRLDPLFPTNGVNVDTGSGLYTRSVGGDNYLAWEGGTAAEGGFGGMSFNYNDGYHADPWTIAK